MENNYLADDNKNSIVPCDAPVNSSNSIGQGWRTLLFKEEYLSNREWFPSLEFMSQESYDEQMKIYKEAESRVVFKNTYVDYESCDCGDGYGCSHEPWPYEICVFDEDRKHTVNRIVYEDGEQLFIEGKIHCATLNKIYTELTLGDFYDFCKLVGITIMLDSEQNPERSVATESASSNTDSNTATN
jgi:hypothetical protein